MPEMIDFVALDHVVVRVTNLEQALHFYRDVLGMDVERELEAGLVQLRAGASLVDLVPVDSEFGRLGGAAPGKDGHNMDHFCLSIGEFKEDDIRNWLTANGIAVGSVERRYGAGGYGPSLYLNDPDGNTVELKGPPDVG